MAKLLINCVKQVPFKSRMMTAGVISDDPSIGQFRSIFNDCDSEQGDQFQCKWNNNLILFIF